MEMERINDNTIRVMIENADLKERGVSVMELLENHDRIESFFYNILSEVDTEHDFEEDDQITFQILPNRNGLELFISKLDDDNEVGDVINNLMAYAKNKSDKVDELSEERRTELKNSDENKKVAENVQAANSSVAATIITLELPEFESAISIAHVISDSEILSNLYRYDNVFYLTLKFPAGVTSDVVAIQKALAIEFAKESTIQSDVLYEHAEKVMSTDALQQIKDIF
ncbi:adaptor protein MecA [Leuconostoc carnosum]|uniref:Adaptor protein n=2 Tax=Leuconostoc carnosum TaxID=1252 RepID=K0DB48_LEUCJ|nr:adaptor protein MecA [Leuconostoc carnosum]AFT82093.1 adaptor protein [Leuconostoc carnosum JB16]KAA8328660.1 adaptor protein MecA [Leuconostoc carnosum]QEA33865.1 adaptor protein MecA [Leuconostoc carnosum]